MTTYVFVAKMSNGRGRASAPTRHGPRGEDGPVGGTPVTKPMAAKPRLVHLDLTAARPELLPDLGPVARREPIAVRRVWQPLALCADVVSLSASFALGAALRQPFGYRSAVHLQPGTRTPLASAVRSGHGRLRPLPPRPEAAAAHFVPGHRPSGPRLGPGCHRHPGRIGHRPPVCPLAEDRLGRSAVHEPPGDALIPLGRAATAYVLRRHSSYRRGS